MVRRLTESGYSVRAVTHKAKPPVPFGPSAEMWESDVCDRDSIRRVVEGARLFFHLAARLHVLNPGVEVHSDYWRVNVEGTRNVVDACAEEGVERLVYVSTISVYGPTVDRGLDESDVPRPDSLYGETKLAAEKLVLATRRHSSAPFSSVVLRMAAIYGPRMRGNYLRLVKALSQGLFVPVGAGSNRRTVVHEEDAVAAILLAGQNPRAAGKIYNVSDGKIHSLREIIAAICAALGRRPPQLFVPQRSACALARVADKIMSAVGQSSNWAALVDKFTEDVAVRADRIVDELGFRPIWDLEKGWQQTIAAWNAESQCLGLAPSRPLGTSRPV